MLTQTAILSTGAEVTLREMTWAEVKRVRDEGATLPFAWPIEQQQPASVLDPLPNSEIRSLAQIVYDLTYGTPTSGKN